VTDGDPTAGGTPDNAPQRRAAKRELALTLIKHLETDELPLSAVIDRIETVTTSPSLTREILDTAEKRGLIEREDGRIQVRRGGSFVRRAHRSPERSSIPPKNGGSSSARTAGFRCGAAGASFVSISRSSPGTASSRVSDVVRGSQRAISSCLRPANSARSARRVFET